MRSYSPAGIHHLLVPGATCRLPVILPQRWSCCHPFEQSLDRFYPLPLPVGIMSKGGSSLRTIALSEGGLLFASLPSGIRAHELWLCQPFAGSDSLGIIECRCPSSLSRCCIPSACASTRLPWECCKCFLSWLCCFQDSVEQRLVASDTVSSVLPLPPQPSWHQPVSSVCKDSISKPK